MTKTGFNIKRWVFGAGLLSSGLAAIAQVNNAGALYNAGNMRISGSHINNGSLTNTGSLLVGGDLTNNGSTGYTGGTLVLNGGAAQAVQGSNTFSTSAVTFSNAAGIGIIKCLSVGATATFSSGLVATPTGSTEPLEFAAGATHAGTSHNSHVNGYARKMGTGAFTYPVGDALRYQPVDANLTANASGMTVKYMPADAGSAPFSNTGSDPVPLMYYNQLEYWDIEPVSSATGNVTVYWDGYNNTGITALPDLRTAHKSGGKWLNEGTNALGNLVTGNITSNPVSNWGPFALGSWSPTSTLPVSLTTFDANVKDCKTVMLNWYVAMETNLSGYELQYSKDASHFTSLGEVSPKGNYSNYEYPYSPTSKSTVYFRLKVTEMDGASSYSSIIDANVTCTENTIKVYPAVTSDLVTIEPGDDSELQCLVYDLKGTLLLEKTINGNSALSLSAFSDGLYSLVVTGTGGHKEFFKIIKNN